MDDNKNLDKIDELLESTSAENRIKFSLSDIESTDTTLEGRFGTAPEDEYEEEIPSPTVEVTPVEEEFDDVEEIAEAEEPEYVAAPVMKIIDETSTIITDDEPVKAETPEQKPAKKKVKFNALQIILIVVFSIATLWSVIYTVDHTLAAQGYSPAFSISSTSYDDGSVSFKCLGYKVQFMYDSNDNLTQKCVPFWEDGPNDIRFNQGLLFEVQE